MAISLAALSRYAAEQREPRDWYNMNMRKRRLTFQFQQRVGEMIMRIIVIEVQFNHYENSDLPNRVDFMLDLVSRSSRRIVHVVLLSIDNTTLE
jgi:hypothetical protein